MQWYVSVLGYKFLRTKGIHMLDVEKSTREQVALYCPTRSTAHHNPHRGQNKGHVLSVPVGH